MAFSKEEQQIWFGSEVMRELERIARERGDMFETPIEAYQPIKTADEGDPNFEDEGGDEEKLLDALKEFEDDPELTEETKSIEEQREHEVPLDEEDILPAPEHDRDKDVGLSSPEDDDFLDWDEEDDKQPFGDAEVRPWDWRGTDLPTKITSNLADDLTKLAHYLGKEGRVKEAYLVERALMDINMILKGDFTDGR